MQQNRPRILFVDDHEDIPIIVALVLGQSHYDVTTVDGVESGLRLAMSGAFDLYLLDSRFADGTGKELCQKIRDFDRETPIVFYTGEPRKQQEDAMTCGAQDSVTKPEIFALPDVVRRVLRMAA